MRDILNNINSNRVNTKTANNQIQGGNDNNQGEAKTKIVNIRESDKNLQNEGNKKRIVIKHSREMSDNNNQTELSNKIIKSNDVETQVLKITQKDKSQSEIFDVKAATKKIESNLESKNEVKCTICYKPQNVKLLHIKCHYENCFNFFCNDCYKRNFYQYRTSNVKCDYFSCDTCKRKKLCIMTSILCNTCDKRICDQCYKIHHSDHSNIKYFE